MIQSVHYAMEALQQSRHTRKVGECKLGWRKASLVNFRPTQWPVKST